MGEIGSLKNRWKRWWQNKKRHKMLEEQEIEENKKRKYSRFQVITRTIFGLFLGLMETTIFSSRKKDHNASIKNMKIEVQTMVEDASFVKQKQAHMMGDIPSIKSKKELIEIKEEHTKLQKSIFLLKEKQKEVEKKVEKVKIEHLKPAQRKKKNETIVPMIKKQKMVLDELEQNQKYIEEKIIQQEEIVTKDDLEQEVLLKKTVGIDVKREELLHYLKENNQYMEEIDKVMMRLSEPIGDDEIGLTLFVISNLYDKIFPLYLTESSIRSRILFSKYKNDQELRKIDKVGFIMSSGIYKNRLDQCNQMKKELQLRGYNRNIKKEEQKINKSKLEEKMEIVNQLDIEKKQLKNTLLEQRIMIDSLETSLEKLTGPKKKKGILSRLGSLVKNTLFVGLGLTGIFHKKRSMVSILTGVLLTNHGIRGMRNMNRSSKDKISYFDIEKILEQIKSEKDALVMSLDFCSDSLEQLSKLQIEVTSLYPYTDDIEVIALKEQLYELKEQLVGQQQVLLEHQHQMELAYEKGVQKIKKLEENLK